MIVCPLCAALVFADGFEQHARVHALDVDRRLDDDPPYRCDLQAAGDPDVHDDLDRPDHV